MKRHWLYCVQAIESQKVKIGTTNVHPNQRLSEMQKSSPEPLELLAAKPFDNSSEVSNIYIAYCKEFAPLLAKGNGGWFNYPEINELFMKDNWLIGEDIPKTNKIEAIPVKVQKPTYDKIKTYASITGRSAASVIDEALLDWMSNVGESRIESIAERANTQGVMN